MLTARTYCVLLPSSATKLDAIVDGALSHSWILARIAFIFKTTEFGLARIEGVSQPNELHSFLAGCAAGYFVMVSESVMKSRICCLLPVV